MVLYRLILSLALPVLILRLALRAARGRETWAELAERLGGGSAAAKPGALWLHAASNGELTSALGLLKELRDRRPGLDVIVTTNSRTGRALARAQGMTGRLAPLDARWCVCRFLARHTPRALVSLESEIWPNRFALCARRGVPVLMIAARMSERSARAWARLPGLAPRLFALPRFVSAQDRASADRLVALGLPPGRLGPVVNLKAAPSLPAPDPGALAALSKVFDRAETVLAASTHPGDEALILRAFVMARAARPRLRLILAPRHPSRRAEIVAEAERLGLPLAIRSAGQAPGDAPVYLADTLGEMALWYRLAGATIVAGSFSDCGGHTPFEPAAAGSAILHGTDVRNFTESYAALDAGGGAIACPDAEALSRALVEFGDPARRDAVDRAAQAILAAGAPDLSPLLAAIEAALDQPEGR